MSADARRRLKAERAVAGGKGLGFLAPEVSDLDGASEGPRSLVTDADPRADEKLLRLGIDPLAGRLAHNVPMQEAEAMARDARLRIQGSAAQALVSRQHAEAQSAAAMAAQSTAAALMPKPKLDGGTFTKRPSGRPKQEMPEWRKGKSSASTPTRGNPIMRSSKGTATLPGLEPEAAAPASKWGGGTSGSDGAATQFASVQSTAGAPRPVSAQAPTGAPTTTDGSGILSEAHMAAFRKTQWLV